MRKLLPVVAGLLLSPTALFSDSPGPASCIQALEQVATLRTEAPVYKLTASGQRSFIHDADRPAEIARLQEIVRASCSSDPGARASQESEAHRLHVALSPECTNEREKLAAIERPEAHEPADAIAQSRKLVAANCPAVDPKGRWLVQWMGRSDLIP
jgi:hypothetical protein